MNYEYVSWQLLPRQVEREILSPSLRVYFRMLSAQVLSKKEYRILNYTLSCSFVLLQSKLDTMAVYQ